MSKNKNKYKHRVRTERRDVNGGVFPGAMAAILVIAAVLSIGYLWICGRNEDLGKRIKELEIEKQSLDRRVINEEFKWSNATSPENIQRLLLRHHLMMELPKERSIARVKRATDGMYYSYKTSGTSYALKGDEASHD